MTDRVTRVLEQPEVQKALRELEDASHELECCLNDREVIGYRRRVANAYETRDKARAELVRVLLSVPPGETPKVEYASPETVAERLAEAVKETQERCPQCKGTGLRKVVRVTDTCPFCRGTGKKGSPSPLPQAVSDLERRVEEAQYHIGPLDFSQAAALEAYRDSLVKLTEARCRGEREALPYKQVAGWLTEFRALILDGRLTMANDEGTQLEEIIGLCRRLAAPPTEEKKP